MSSSSVVQALFLICGSRWFCQRSRHCFAVRWIMCLEIRVQFIVPYFFTSSAICQSKRIGKCCIRHILIRFIVAFSFAPFHLHLWSSRFLKQWDPGAYSNVAYTAIPFAPFSETDIQYLNLTESTLKPLYNLFSVTPRQYLQVKNWQWFSNRIFQSC